MTGKIQNHKGEAACSSHIMVLVILALLVGLNGYRFWFSSTNEEPVKNLCPYVYEIKGDVPQPGLYWYSVCPTVKELLYAGGQTADMKLIVNRKPGGMLVTGSTLKVQRTRKGLRVDLLPLEGNKKLLLGIPLDLNTATPDDFASLPGIGPQSAHDLVLFRKTCGKFSAVEDIKAVKGIGEKRFKKIEKYLTVTTETVS